jgi:hypothetical protein
VVGTHDEHIEEAEDKAHNNIMRLVEFGGRKKIIAENVQRNRKGYLN